MANYWDYWLIIVTPRNYRLIIVTPRNYRLIIVTPRNYRLIIAAPRNYWYYFSKGNIFCREFCLNILSVNCGI